MEGGREGVWPIAIIFWRSLTKFKLETWKLHFYLLIWELSLIHILSQKNHPNHTWSQTWYFLLWWWWRIVTHLLHILPSHHLPPPTILTLACGHSETVATSVIYYLLPQSRSDKLCEKRSKCPLEKTMVTLFVRTPVGDWHCPVWIGENAMIFSPRFYCGKGLSKNLDFHFSFQYLNFCWILLFVLVFSYAWLAGS